MVRTAISPVLRLRMGGVKLQGQRIITRQMKTTYHIKTEFPFNRSFDFPPIIKLKFNSNKFNVSSVTTEMHKIIILR